MKYFLASVLALCLISAEVLINIYSSLNITEDQAKESLAKSILQGAIWRTVGSEDLVRNARALSIEDRVEGIKQLMQMAKEYTKTEEFKKEYKKLRNEKLNPDSKSKLGVPKFGKIIQNKIDNKLDKAENEKNYPENAMDMVKKRLSDFLEISATVDYDAEVNSGQFVKPEYQKKGSWWKMCYRAGKPVVDAARVEAKAWLEELNK
jgi:hypothetical protein